MRCRDEYLPLAALPGAIRFGLVAGLLGAWCAYPSAPARALPLESAVVVPNRVDTPLEASEFEVRVGDLRAEVVELERMAPAPGGLSWQVLVYFDTPLLTPRGRDQAIRTLNESAEALVALGPVSIVAADPEPVELVKGAQRPHEIVESLRLFQDRTTLAGELIWRRLRFLEAVRQGDVDEERARLEMEREQGLLDRQRAALLGSLGRRSGERPGLLILVQDGFDFDFKRFYLSRTAELDELESGVDEAHAVLCRAAAARGWTVLGLALGERGSELARPREPLAQLAEATGGDLLLEASALEPALAGLGGRVRLTYDLALPVDELRPLDVKHRERSARGPRWAGRAGSGGEVVARTSGPETTRSAVRLLSPGAGPHVGPTRLTAITGEHEIGYVAFFLDGFLVDVAYRPPFLTRIDLGGEPTVHTVRAAAFSPEALELGEDTLQLNERDAPYRIDIVDVLGDPENGEVELRAAVSTPPGRRLERVDFYWNDELGGSLEAPDPGDELALRMSTVRPGPGDHYRAIASWDDGNRLETARLALGGRLSERLDVNLVELYAMVTDRQSSPLEDLTRDDFAVFHDGRTQAIEEFSRARDLPLTLGLAVDTSASMADWQDDLRDAAAVFFESILGEDDRAFLVDFDDRAHLTQPPTDRQELLVGRMGALDFGGYTSLYDAILFALTQFERQGGRKALVVLSDGDDYGSRFRPDRCIEQALQLGVPVYMAVLEDPGDPLTPLERMVAIRLARQTGGQAHFFSSRPRLTAIYDAIEADLRSQYLLTYALASPMSAAELGDIRVEVSDPRLSVRTFLGRSVRAQ